MSNTITKFNIKSFEQENEGVVTLAVDNFYEIVRFVFKGGVSRRNYRMIQSLRRVSRMMKTLVDDSIREFGFYVEESKYACGSCDFSWFGKMCRKLETVRYLIGVGMNPSIDQNILIKMSSSNYWVEHVEYLIQFSSVRDHFIANTRGIRASTTRAMKERQLHMLKVLLPFVPFQDVIKHALKCGPEVVSLTLEYTKDDDVSRQMKRSINGVSNCKTDEEEQNKKRKIKIE